MSRKDPYSQVSYVTSALLPNQYPNICNPQGVPLPEIAVAGRSNVGKSTLLNHLFCRKDLVKTSSTPGKTQALNFFDASGELLFVDLPGYGYTNAPPKASRRWAEAIDTYLNKRENLKLVLFLLDIRRTPSREDVAFMEWACFHKKPYLLVFTKCDKVNLSTRRNTIYKIVNSNPPFSSPPSYVVTSVIDKLGRNELAAAIARSVFRDEAL